MQCWANTDSNNNLFHAFTGESGTSFRAMCNKAIRPADRHRRGDVRLFSLVEVNRFPMSHRCEGCTVKVDALAKTAPRT